MKDTYQTITELSTGEFKDRGSKFLAYAYPVYSEEEGAQRLAEVRKMHPKARHHCYAYRLGLDGNRFRANDDGEPSGTAGRPILGQIDRFELSNLLVVVVRYFGGTKLGTSGLINAYKLSTADALEQAGIIEKKVRDIYRLTFPYSLMSEVMNSVKKLNLNIRFQEFTEQGLLEIALPQSERDLQLKKLMAAIAKIRLEELENMEEWPEIEGLEMKYLSTE